MKSKSAERSPDPGEALPEVGKGKHRPAPGAGARKPWQGAPVGQGEPEWPTVYLHPGHVFVSASPAVVTTVLGSCVAICLWDPVIGAGGLNHYLLPHWAGFGEDSTRFGNVAFRRLILDLAACGAHKQRLLAKIFGGACVLPGALTKTHLGAKNVELARKLLDDAGIPIMAEDVGAECARKLIVHTDTGDAWIKRL